MEIHEEQSLNVQHPSPVTSKEKAKSQQKRNGDMRSICEFECTLDGCDGAQEKSLNKFKLEVGGFKKKKTKTS